jgi:acylphosphatase/peptidoglycan hydrolase-like protein with peptidoglycan-binding domain
MAADDPSEEIRERMRGRSTLPIPESTLEKGDRGDDVERLFEYLKRFGYFPNPELRTGNLLFRPAVPFEPEDTSRYDDRIEAAVRKFQQQHGLEVTGKVDDETLALMRQPRCGFPDRPVDGVVTFVVQGNRWPTNNVSFRFDNTTPDLSQNDQQGAVRGAFDRWAAVTPLNFSETTGAADIRVSWRAGNHGDGDANAFDGPSGILAHCFYPPPNGGDIAGDCHFDEAETWSVNSPPSGIDLPTVALHELGHGLGLDHSADTSAVMYAFYGGPRRELTADDIQGIQSIYGARYRWGSLGGVVFNPAVENNADGRLEAFARGTDGALWNIWQTAPNNGWSGWNSLGGGIQGKIAVDRNADGRLEVFVKGTDGALWNIWQTAPNNGWSGWNSLGGLVYAPVVMKNADGRLEVFVRGGDNAVWNIWQTAPNNGWSGWNSLGGQITAGPVVGRNQDGRLEVFVRGTDGAVWNIWQTAPNNGWSGWNSLGGVIQGPPVVARNADGRLEVFAKGTDGALWQIWQTAPNNGWSGWATLGGLIWNPAVVNNADGRLEVFVRGADNALWNIWQTAPNNGWSGWGTLDGQMIAGPVASRNQDGRLEVFVKGTDGGLWNTWQSAPNNGWN